MIAWQMASKMRLKKSRPLFIVMLTQTNKYFFSSTTSSSTNIIKPNKGSGFFFVLRLLSCAISTSVLVYLDFALDSISFTYILAHPNAQILVLLFTTLLFVLTLLDVINQALRTDFSLVERLFIFEDMISLLMFDYFIDLLIYLSISEFNGMFSAFSSRFIGLVCASYDAIASSFFFDYLLLYVLTILPVLLAVAYVILWERKLMASVQRRRGPNVVGVYGLLQPLIDAVKLLLKEVLVPMKVNQFLFVLGPVLFLVVALTLWTFLPFSESNYYYDYEYGLLLFLGISSLGPYGLIIAGWSSNSSYAVLGGVRSIAQFISYEAVIGLLLLPIVMYVESVNFIEIVLFQSAFMWFVFPLFPIFMWFFIAILAETNRTPFDLPEAEAELVAGYNTEYAGVFFIMFMLAEYSNVLCMSAVITLLFFGGWTFEFVTTVLSIAVPAHSMSYIMLVLPELIFAIKIVIIVFFFILIRATLPRFRFDQLMFYCWCNLLPLVLGTILLLLGIYIVTIAMTVPLIVL